LRANKLTFASNGLSRRPMPTQGDNAPPQIIGFSSADTSLAGPHFAGLMALTDRAAGRSRLVESYLLAAQVP
jgi:hypothetical protein